MYFQTVSLSQSVVLLRMLLEYELLTVKCKLAFLALITLFQVLMVRIDYVLHSGDFFSSSLSKL